MAEVATAQAEALLTALYGDLKAGEFVELRAIAPDDVVLQYFFDSPKVLLSAASRLSGTNVYYGLGIRLGRNGNKEHTARVGAAYADVDFKVYPDSEAGARAALARFPLPPSAIIHSGGGLQSLWLLREPAEPDGFERLEAVNRGLTVALAPDGKRLDSAIDASRVFRLPDTWNLKYKPPVRTRLVELHPERRYTLSDLAEYLPIDYPPAESSHSSNGSGTSPHTDNGLTVEQIIGVARNAKNGPKFISLFERGDLSPYQGDDSKADQALMSLLAFYTDDPDVLDSLFRRSGLYREEKWGQRSDYRARTIQKALEGRTEFYRTHYTAPLSANDHHPIVPAQPHLTDLGNARRLVARHGHDLRYVPKWGKWLFWDGRRWAVDEDGEVYRRAKETIGALYVEAAALQDAEERKRLASWALKSEAEARITAMVSVAESETGVPVTPDDLDQNPMLLNCKNATVDLKDGRPRSHDRSDLITKLAPVTYAPDSKALLWRRCLGQWHQGNKEVIGFLQRAAGYSATGDTRERKIFFNIGGGSNGKGVFTETVGAALGDYAQKAPTELLLPQHPGSVPTEVADLKGVRYVFASESDEGARLAEAKVKDLSGGDTVVGRHMRQDFFRFRPTHKVWLSTNHKPVIRGSDDAIWDRIALIPWNVRFEGDALDKDLPNKLLAELPGILNWIVEGCLQWQMFGLGEPATVHEATQGYRTEQDILGLWIAEDCIVDPDATWIAGNCYVSYRQWAKRMNEQPITQTAFGLRMAERGFAKRRVGTRNVLTYLGIRLNR